MASALAGACTGQPDIEQIERDVHGAAVMVEIQVLGLLRLSTGLTRWDRRIERLRAKLPAEREHLPLLILSPAEAAAGAIAVA